MQTQICTKCKIEKPITEFSKNIQKGTNFKNMSPAFKKQTYRLMCKACYAEYARRFRKKHTNYRGSNKVNKYPKDQRLLVSAIRCRLSQCKSNYKKRNGKIICNLTADYLYDLFIKQNGRCVYTNEKMRIEPKSLLTLSLDRIIPKLGYVKGNVQWVC